MGAIRGNITPLSYEGVRAPFPPNVTIETRAPDTGDRKNFVLGDLWLDRTTKDVYILVSLESNIATWKFITSDGSIGTWTPQLNFGGAHANMTFVTREGYYYRTGLLIYFYGRIALQNKGISTGSATIDDLPFVGLNTIGGVPITFSAVQNLVYTGIPGAQIIANTSQMQLREYVTGAIYNVMDETYFNNDSIFVFAGSYIQEI